MKDVESNVFPIAGVSDSLPWLYGPGDETFPTDLVGAELLRIGSIPESHLLVIDYMPRESADQKQLIVGFGDDGMWIVK